MNEAHSEAKSVKDGDIVQAGRVLGSVVLTLTDLVGALESKLKPITAGDPCPTSGTAPTSKESTKSEFAQSLDGFSSDVGACVNRLQVLLAKIQF